MYSWDNQYSSAAEPGLLIGFHGCDKKVRDAIVMGKTTLRPSERSYDWLGHGCYFWQNSYERALDFAMHPPPGRVIHHPAVLGAVLNLGYCLDLLGLKGTRALKTGFDNLIFSYGERGIAMPQNVSPITALCSKDKVLRYLDCEVIEYLHKMAGIDGRPFDSVRGVFTEGDPVYADADFYEKTHIQVCIRNPNCIKGYFIPKEEMEEVAINKKGCHY